MSNITASFNTVADGVALTNANTPFSSGTGGVASTDTPYRGAACARFAAAGASASLSQTHAATISEHHVRFYVRPQNTPSGSVLLFAARNADNTASAFDLRSNTSGQVSVRDSSAATIGTSSALPLGVWSRIEIDAVAGALEARFYLGGSVDSTTPTQTISGSFASTVISRCNVGVLAAATWTLDVDEYAGNDATQPGPITNPGGGGSGFTGWGIAI